MNKKYSVLRLRRISLSAPLLFFVLIAGLKASAEVRLPSVFSDHAVLQREKPIPVWGTAEPGEKVTVSLHKQTVKTVAGANGAWSVKFSPEKAGGPYVLTVQARNRLQRNDILIGDVWFASGQSNMQFPLMGFNDAMRLKNGEEEIAHASQPNIRLLLIKRAAVSEPAADQDSVWTECSPETAKTFSAVAYFFARDIGSSEHVPIGIIDSSWGGTPISSWLSHEADPPALAATQMQTYESHKTNVEKQDIAKNAKATTTVNPNITAWTPSYLFNGMVAPLTRYAIKGVLWYQGEADAAPRSASFYQQMLPTLIKDWRTQWAQPELPFLYVQISGFDAGVAQQWGMIRDAQRRALALPDTGMAVSFDVGEPQNIHPGDKQTVAHRLVLAARAVAYGEKLEYSGPLFSSITQRDSTTEVHFTHANKLSIHGTQLQGFEVADADHCFRPVAARLEGDKVVIDAPGKKPVYVRYAWANFPQGNLYNDADLPVATFTSETDGIGSCSANAVQQKAE
jgi:sialate O-acetylesterase